MTTLGHNLAGIVGLLAVPGRALVPPAWAVDCVRQHGRNHFVVCLTQGVRDHIASVQLVRPGREKLFEDKARHPQIPPPCCRRGVRKEPWRL